MEFGQCKDTAIEFVNDTGLTVTVPSEGHRVRNPGSLEGWNILTLGADITDLAPGASRTVRQNLTIKCIRDAEFQIVYSSTEGDEFTQRFANKDLKDRNAVLTLTNN